MSVGADAAAPAGVSKTVDPPADAGNRHEQGCREQLPSKQILKTDG